MSLIDEALKRAEEKAGREAPRNRPWVPTPLPDAGLARRRRMVRATLAGLAAGLCIAALAALLIWAAGYAPRVGATSAKVTNPADRQSEPLPRKPVAADASEAEGRAAGGGNGAAPVRPAPAVASAPTRTPFATVPLNAALPESVVPTPVRVAHASRPDETLASASGSPLVRSRSAEAAAKTYHARLTLPDGGTLELGGIVWSEKDPRALVNDRVVGAGAYVDGYTVERIEEDRVVFEKDGKRIALLVR